MHTPITNIKQGFTVLDLSDRPNFVAWCEEERNGRKTKVPKNPETGLNASSTNSNTWGSREDAERLAKKLLKQKTGLMPTSLRPLQN